jgi:DNA-binding CsgD family transcriptional regulator
MEIFVSHDFYTRSQRATRAINARHAGFLTEHDVYTDEELAADPLYHKLLWPAGLGWGAATVIPLPTGDTLFLSVERERARGPMERCVVQQLDALRPHLARSALMSARLQLERARAAAETLALIGLPALVFDERGKVLAANHLIEALTDHIRWRAQDRVSLKDSSADALFHQIIETLNIENAAPTRSFAMRGAEDAATMVAHVIPVRRSARDIFVRCAGVLVLTPVTLPQAPPVELVQSLFDLTPAEARVARGLAAGGTVEEIAFSGGVSHNTIRTQVRGVLEKTGCRRQAEVVALLGGIAMPRG